MKNNPSRNDKIFDIILEESFDKYANDIAKNDIECEMTEEELQIMENKENSIYNKLMKDIDANKKIRISTKKVCILVAILLLGVIGVSFGAPAIYTWVQRTNLSVSENEINITTNTLVFEDYKSITNFKNKKSIIVPNHLPEGMELIRLNDEENSLDFYYKKDDIFLTITMFYDFETSTETIDTENNNYTIRESNILGVQCKIITMTSESGLTIHSVYWDSDNTSYSLMTNVSEEELNKILENLVYFEE